MLNYTKVFTGNFNEVQYIFNELVLLNVCAIIRDKSRIDGLKNAITSNESLQDILVHKDELKSTQTIIKRLTSELQT